ncbi:MAG: Nramp family divalent metal transporter [Cyclobacteriaceae bacterium]
MFKKLKNIGPGAMVAAAFIGPGTVTTATLAGATYGYTLLWAILFSIVATYVLQEMSARLGVIGQSGVGEAIRTKTNNKTLRILSSVLVISAVLIGNAAYEAGNITGAVMGFSTSNNSSLLILLIGISAFALLFTGQFKLLEKSLVGLVAIMGIVFLAAAIMVNPDWSEILKGIFIPVAPDGAFIMIVGLIGTTVVPYNLFLHASASKKKWSSEQDYQSAKSDTLISVIFGGIITMAILITATAAFDGKSTEILSATDLGSQLKPILGDWSSIFISFGFLAAGLSSSITAPIAAAFATSEVLGWEDNLRGTRFRVVWIAVLLVGIVSSSLGFRPTSVILFAQVANGILLPVIAVFLLWIVNDRKIMKDHVNTRMVNILGVIVILITIGLGIKGIYGVFG